MKNNFRIVVAAVIVSGLLAACAGVRTAGDSTKTAVSPPEAQKAPEPTRAPEPGDTAGSTPAAPAPRAAVQEPHQKRAADSAMTWRAETGPAAPGKLLISGLNLEQNGLEIIAGERIVSYRVLTLTQPSRLVVEIGNCRSGFTQKSLTVNRLGIATVSFEETSGALRVILEGGSQRRLIPYRIRETDRGLKVIITDQ